MAALYIRSHLSTQEWQVWPVAVTLPPGAVQEGGTYYFELRSSQPVANADLYVDDVAAEALRSLDPQVARWRWAPGFHAGVVEVTLTIPGTGTTRFEVTTDPDVRKLTREDFDAMVRELLSDTFALYSLSGFRTGIAAQAGARAPPIARLEFLRSRIKKIVAAVDAIQRSPRHILSTERAVIPAHRAPRASGSDVLRSFRSGLIGIETSSPSRLPAPLKGRLPAKLSIQLTCSSTDIQEHRQILACLRAWASWLSVAADLIENKSSTNDQEQRSNAKLWSLRARVLRDQLNRAAKSPFLANVGPSSPHLTLSALFRRDARYASFFKLWNDMNAGLANVFGDFLQMPLARTFELYELWCFIRLVRAAVEEYGATGVDFGNVFFKDSTGSINITSGQVVVPLAGGLAIAFKRRFQEYWVEPDGEGSFSRTMIPDLVLAAGTPHCPPRRLIVLDAKYRINDGLNDALNSIHTYRDALVGASLNEIQGIVRAAYILTPYVPDLAFDFEATPVPGRLFHPKYREKFRFGAVTLRPGMELSELRLCLREIVDDAAVSHE